MEFQKVLWSRKRSRFAREPQKVSFPTKSQICSRAKRSLGMFREWVSPFTVDSRDLKCGVGVAIGEGRHVPMSELPTCPSFPRRREPGPHSHSTGFPPARERLLRGSWGHPYGWHIVPSRNAISQFARMGLRIKATSPSRVGLPKPGKKQRCLDSLRSLLPRVILHCRHPYCRSGSCR